VGFEALGGRTVHDRERWGGRLPPGQHEARGWPVLHYGSVPAIQLDTWRFRVGGRCEQPLELDWQALRSLPRHDVVADMHCVTRWSTFDNAWCGVRPADILALASPLADARFVLVHGAHGYTANLPIDVLFEGDVLLAHSHNDAPLSAEHGGPLRLVVPRLYAWKSVKWVEGFTLLAEDQPGFWERFAYHNHGDPWREQRYASGRVRTPAR